MKIMRHKTDGKRKLINKRQKLEDGWEREREIMGGGSSNIDSVLGKLTH